MNTEVTDIMLNRCLPHPLLPILSITAELSTACFFLGFYLINHFYCFLAIFSLDKVLVRFYFYSIVALTFCQLAHKLGSSGKRETQLRICLHQTGL